VNTVTTNTLTHLSEHRDYKQLNTLVGEYMCHGFECDEFECDGFECHVFECDGFAIVSVS